VLEDHGLINASFLAFMAGIEKEGITKVLKKYKVYRTTGARHTKTTWVHDPTRIIQSTKFIRIA
jgi:hypothetical protein